MSELTRLPWTEVYELPIMDTLAYLSFHNYKVQRQEQAIKNFKKGIK